VPASVRFSGVSADVVKPAWLVAEGMPGFPERLALAVFVTLFPPVSIARSVQVTVCVVPARSGTVVLKVPVVALPEAITVAPYLIS
jgi:hypothetical protein